MQMTIPAAAYVIAVRALCEFVAKKGDLDLRFTPSPSAQEGIAGHVLVADSRDETYQTEIALVGKYKHLTVKGRADGFDTKLNRLEEIKTHRVPVDKIPSNHRALHWCQAKIYAALLCERDNLERIEVALVYFHIDSHVQTFRSETCTREALQAFFSATCEVFLAWSDREASHRRVRNVATSQVVFPFDEMHDQQRQFAQAIYRAAVGKRSVIAQAPTGVGKTLGSLFPTFKALGKAGIDKVIYLTAKTSGRALALDAVKQIQIPHHGLRTLELVAREKSCENLDKACNGDSCPLAKGFYDRLPQARNAATALAENTPVLWSKAKVREVALSHAICPYYLSQELAKWADVVIGDYNYFFDTNAILYHLVLANDWQVALLVDEAHNLVDRARAMYSARLSEQTLLDAQPQVPESLKKDFNRLLRLWRRLVKAQDLDYEAFDKVPDKLSGAIDSLVTALGKVFIEETERENFNLQEVDRLFSLFFELLHFQKMNLVFDKHFFFEIDRETMPSMHIRNVLPAPLLAPRFAAAASCALFSATLNPISAYKANLGLPSSTVELEVESPFSANQLQVKVIRKISTRYKDRNRSLSLLVETMANQYQQLPGNYLAFFSSFDYLEQVVHAFSQTGSRAPVWQQTRGMSEFDRIEFLAKFKAGGKGIGFAVLGGVFGEGVDLPGDRLLGVFIATIGLPQINKLNQQLHMRLENLLEPGQGYKQIYLYPGLQKVVQAAGRVIRSKSDQGVLLLLDNRFATTEVRELLPKWWDIKLT
jgi:DNA excision repair protein ERCC-2